MLRLTEPTVAARTLRRYYRTNFAACTLTSQHYDTQPKVKSEAQSLQPGTPRRNHTLLSLNKPLPPLPKGVSLPSLPPTLSSTMSPSVTGWSMYTNVPISEPTFPPHESEVLGFYKVLQQGPGERRRRKWNERNSWRAKMKRAGEKTVAKVMLCQSTR